ncbi:ABC transporter permease [Metapseudomonas furukawaii]|uniref:Ferric iron ABC transporter n=1 Tax=Metapseudomonas furukawaii TaxID=1149133 RepID=A0AAD1BU82_METFU|nr:MULTISPECIES: iron ABC transporter permease [Pseudomonas]ELS24813.1 Ferric iron ABC transporter, permease protein [Pseudomonas furukawaii]OWJ89535.1 iron ABC transporter permease [Pseudomonas sp. A46]BAU72349.1 ferric iron ABC transporter [Pseudomonas furukawaii]
MNSRLPSIWHLLALCALALLLTFLLWPLANLLFSSVFGAGAEGTGWSQLRDDPSYLRALGNTLLLGCLVTACAGVLGVSLAYVTARFDFPGKALVAVLPVCTLVVPEVIVSQTWLMILGNNGLLTRILDEHLGLALPSFYGWPGLVLVMSLVYYTYIYLGTLAAIRGFDAQLEEAAQSLGTPPARARLQVMLPVVMPAVLASGLLVFTLAVGNFAIATLLGGKVQLLSVLTYLSFISEMGTNASLQSALATLSIAIVAGVLFLQRWLVSRKRYEIVQGRSAPARRLRGIRGLLLGGGTVLFILLSSLPLLMVLVSAFTQSRGPVMQWGVFSLDNLGRVLLRNPEPILNTLAYGALATLIGILLSVVISYLVIKKKNLLTPAIDYLAMLPLAMSGTVLGIGLVMTFNTGPLALSGTAAILVVAFVIRRFPFGVRSASATLYNIPDSLEEASISLGVPPLRSFLKVVLPLMAPAVAAAAVLTWTTIVAELSASLVVYSAGRETITIQVFRLIETGLQGQAAAYGLILVLLTLTPVVIATRVFHIKIF